MCPANVTRVITSAATRRSQAATGSSSSLRLPGQLRGDDQRGGGNDEQADGDADHHPTIDRPRWRAREFNMPGTPVTTEPAGRQIDGRPASEMRAQRAAVASISVSMT